MTKLVVKAKNNKIDILQDSVLFEIEERTKLVIDGYEIFLSVKGRDDELRKVKKEIKEVKKAMKELKRNDDPSYYDVRDRLNSLRKTKENLKSIPDEEIEEVVIEILLLNKQLSIVHNGENIVIDDDDRLYYDLSFSKNLTTLRIVIVPLSCFYFTDE